MSSYIEFALPDDSTVLIESDESEGDIAKASRGKKIIEAAQGTLEQAAENARKAALVILEKIREFSDSPDEVEITFGLKASGELGTLVVAKAGIEANYSIKLKWTKTVGDQNVIG